MKKLISGLMINLIATMTNTLELNHKHASPESARNTVHQTAQFTQRAYAPGISITTVISRR